MSPAELQSILYGALASPRGILIKSSDSTKAKQALYSARASLGDPELAVLQFRTSWLPDGDIVIARRAAPRLPSPSPQEILDLL